MKSNQIFLIITIVSIISALFITSCDNRTLEPESYYIETIYASPDSIYADGDNNTYAEIFVKVIDEKGYSASNIEVSFKSTKGSISGKATTGNDGFAIAKLFDNGEIAIAEVEAVVSDDKKNIYVSFIEMPEPQIVEMYAIPDTIYADADDETYAEIFVKIVDENNYPVSGLQVNFTTDKGRIDSFINTNDSGTAKSRLYDNGTSGIATVEATVLSKNKSNNGKKTEIDSKENGRTTSQTITVTFVEAPSYHIAWIRAEPDTIYADNNITYSEIKVKVEDNDNFAVPNHTVYFRALTQGTGETIGGILTTITTDDTGVATSTFWDEGDIGIAVIDAFISNDQASVMVTIEDVPAITSLELDVDADNLNVGESTNLRAFAENSLGIVPDGTIIVFSTTKGVFTDVEGNAIGSHVQIATSNGTALTYFNAGQRSGIATITASLSDMEDSKDIVIRPGPPQYIILTPSVYTIEANSSEDILISAEVEDGFHNPVSSGTGVSFSTDLGTVTPIGYTDSEGVATTAFSPGSIAGLATIQAVADSAQASTVVSITSNDVYSIGFHFQQQVDIQVQGTGGNESIQLRVNLFDVNGNLIDFPQEVFFKFVYAPIGTNINNQVYYPSSDSVSVMSSNGQASCSVSSGMESGIIALKAYTYDQNGNEKSATKSNIVVHSGQPAEVSISNPGHDSATNVGGGQWEMELGGMITDIYGNGVSYGTAVFFSLENNPNWAYIDPAAYVGNENTDGDSLSGTAFTTLTFDGKYTNETVYIQVDVVSNDGLIEFPPIPLVLKGQYLSLDMIATPQYVEWYNDATDKIVDVTIEVYDQQTNEISNQEVYVTSDYGVPESGVYFYTTNDDGVINLQWRFRRREVPTPQGPDPTTVTATITAQILGPGTSESVNVTLRRYP